MSEMNEEPARDGSDDSRVVVNKRRGEVRAILKTFNEDLGVYINDGLSNRLGRVLTIIDASIADPEQRKALKDLIRDGWWGPTNGESRSLMGNPHTDIRGIAMALGFELYVDAPGSLQAAPFEFDVSHAQHRYEKVAREALN